MELVTLTQLPIDDVLPKVVEALKGHRSVAIQGAPGSGKTTRVPPAILLSGLVGQGRVIVLEPRRIAARAACRRIAAERGWQVGGEVGFQVRFERRWGPRTRLVFLTEGVLVNTLQDNPFLDGVTAVVFDEFHERTLETDLALAMVQQLRRELRPDLLVAVMSATFDSHEVSAYLDNCPIVEGGGRLHPVEIAYVGSITGQPAHSGQPTFSSQPAKSGQPTQHIRPAHTGSTCPSNPCSPSVFADHSRFTGHAGRFDGPQHRLDRRVADAVRRAIERTRGDILVFLPGMAEIRRASEALEPLARERDLTLSILHGSLPASEQDAALLSGTRRKVILSTNVAETSLTVEGVEAVVDSGLARILRFDPGVGLDRLLVEAISKESAEQRAGRAGRLRPGLCLRLWSRQEQEGRAAVSVPEIRRVDLAGALLQIMAWGEREPYRFPWFERPERAAVERGLEVLERLGAIERRGDDRERGDEYEDRTIAHADAHAHAHAHADAHPHAHAHAHANGQEHGDEQRQFQVTEMGKVLARFPLHPRLARMLVEGHRHGQAEAMALMAALLSERDPFRGRTTGESWQSGARTASSCVDRLDQLRQIELGRRCGGGAISVSGNRIGSKAAVADTTTFPPPSRLAIPAQAGRKSLARAGDDGETGTSSPQAGTRPDGQRGKGDTATDSFAYADGPADAAFAGAVFKARDQLLRMAERVLGRSPAPSVPLEEAVGRSVLAAYPDRLARLRAESTDRALMVAGRGLRITGAGSSSKDELFVALEVDAGSRGEISEALVRMICPVKLEWLETAKVKRSTQMRFDVRLSRIVAEEVWTYEDLELSSRPAAVADIQESDRLLAEAAMVDPDRALGLDRTEVRRFLSRVRCLAAWMPELELPGVEDRDLARMVSFLCHGLRSFEELRSLPLVEILTGRMTHQQRQALEREAPDRIQVPSGSRLKVEYEPGRPPFLAVRIQEVFGWKENPRLARGRIPVLLHLLSPAGRPQQVTEDLGSFWRATYPEVRKELKGRYPKHSWPEDPSTAGPEMRPVKRKR